jgi:hypothetical protein
MLGRLIDDLEDPQALRALVLALDVPDLEGRIARAAAAAGEEPHVYLAAAVVGYVAEAPDDDWLRLVGLMNRAADPSLAALRAILEKILPPLH